jgi:hypothetical protein
MERLLVFMLGEVELSGRQGLTLVHFSAQLKRFLWDRGAFRGRSGGALEVSEGMKGYLGCIFVSETAQVELKRGRV